MEQNKQATQENPLKKHFRQPAIYIKLPSMGRWWQDGSIELPANGEIPVYPMTTKDEITLKTPDALMNGEGVVSVIQSCCPNIKNAWAMPSLDIDYTLVAIRIASYGQKLELESKCPKCGEVGRYEQNLGPILDTIQSPNYDIPVEVNSLQIYLRPQRYFESNEVNQINFEEQRALQTLDDPLLPEEEKRARIKQNLTRILELNVKVLTYGTRCIKTPEGVEVTDSNQIFEFYQNAETKVTKIVNQRFNEFVDLLSIKPFNIKCGSCSNEYKSAFDFDPSSFFGQGF